MTVRMASGLCIAVAGLTISTSECRHYVALRFIIPLASNLFESPLSREKTFCIKFCIPAACWLMGRLSSCGVLCRC